MELVTCELLVMSAYKLKYKFDSQTSCFATKDYKQFTSCVLGNGACSSAMQKVGQAFVGSAAMVCSRADLFNASRDD
eukprot:6205631-Pleurochrysis_carterae.AAC.1